MQVSFSTPVNRHVSSHIIGREGGGEGGGGEGGGGEGGGEGGGGEGGGGEGGGEAEVVRSYYGDGMSWGAGA